MASVISIKDFRLSFVWVETVLNLLADQMPQNAPMRFLGRRSAYEEKYALVSSAKADASELKPPWHNPDGRSFWTFYFDGQNPGSVIKQEAWKKLVPFRGPVPARLTAPFLKQGRFILEAFYYPHGIALVVTAICLEHLTLDEAVKKSFMIAQGEKLDLEWSEGTKEHLTLNSLADKCLNAIRRGAYGQNANPVSRSITPFTVFTVVRGEGDQSKIIARPKGEIHRALEAVTSWRPTWQQDALPKDFTEVKLQARTGPDSHLLYSRKRGRAVWYPVSFTNLTGRLHSLACYHRNLVFASLQVESLGELTSFTAKRIKEGGGPALSLPHRDCATHAAGILRRLYRGIRPAYRTMSAQAHINQNDFAPDINEVRNYFDMDPPSL